MALPGQINAAMNPWRPGAGAQFNDQALVPVYLGDEAVDATDNYLAALTVAEWVDDPVVTAHLLVMLGLDSAPRQRPCKGRCRSCRRRLSLRANGYVTAHTGPDGASCAGSRQLPARTRGAAA